MNNILHNLSGKINGEHLEALRSIKTTADSLSISFFIVGATARDYLFEHCHKIPTIRKTQDIDLGVEVADWDQFKILTKSLLDKGGFRASRVKQRLYYGDLIVDFVPFGDIADEFNKIAWPPEQEVIMSLLGFREAYEYSVILRLSDNPILDIKVATLPSIAMMKIISWKDQYPERPKDAEDLLFIIKKYGDAGNFDRLYLEKRSLMEEEGFDVELAGARLLGQDIAYMTDTNTLRKITAILEEETQEKSHYQLVADMLRGELIKEDNFEGILHLIKKLKEGLLETKTSKP